MTSLPLAMELALAGCAATLAACLLRIFTAVPEILRGGMTLLLALAGMLEAAAGIAGLTGPGGALLLPAGLPWLPMHLRLDALGAFFLLVIGLLLTPVALYSQGYMRHLRDIGVASVFLPLFVLGMLGVVLADDAFTFMLFWELMSVASYFLVTLEHEQIHNRKAGFIYLLMAHLAGLLILGGFATLYAGAHDFSFAAMRAAQLSPFWASVAFLLAAFGFGMKAGVLPLHVWLPEAHPAAPSNVSALMSGVMLKVAMFGFLRVVWDLLGPGDFQWWWGVMILAAGTSTAFGGILLAVQQNDLKRLLAYSSVENIGIILIGLGLSLLLAHFGYPQLAALGLIAALYHIVNHALFKGLLFMGAGALLHATGLRNLEAMGGLIRRMPVTAVLVLVGCIAISALPPFNGFVSEWLTFQTALMTPRLGGSLLTAIVPFSAAMLALAAALAAAAFVKVFGIAFLGTPRSEDAARAHEVDRWMLAGMAIPAVLCLLLGTMPVVVVPLIDHVPQLLLNVSIAASVEAGGWLWLTPVDAARASYSAPIVLGGMLLLGALAFWLLHPKGGAVRRSPLWSCGHPQLAATMQYTATGFAQPIRRIFADLYRPVEHLHAEGRKHKLVADHIRYAVHIADLIAERVYQPLGKGTLELARLVNKQHKFGIHAYLAYIFATVLVLLVAIV